MMVASLLTLAPPHDFSPFFSRSTNSRHRTSSRSSGMDYGFASHAQQRSPGTACTFEVTPRALERPNPLFDTTSPFRLSYGLSYANRAERGGWTLDANGECVFLVENLASDPSLSSSLPVRFLTRVSRTSLALQFFSRTSQSPRAAFIVANELKAVLSLPLLGQAL